MTTPATPRPWMRPWIRPWGAMTVHAPGNDDVLGSQVNLDFAVRAVNAHDALLAALRALVEAWADSVFTVDGYDEAIRQARALLREVSPKEEGLP